MPTLATVGTSRGAAGARYVPALDGLRALSVLAVIGFHAELPDLGGGFLGVEVFFVVSGYLITSLLLLEHQALSRCLAFGCAVRGVCFRPCLRCCAPCSWRRSRSPPTRSVKLAATHWQVLQQRSYFMAVERPPLLLHLWSLAVEEQFYLFWPLIVALLARHARRLAGPVALFGALASAWWMACS